MPSGAIATASIGSVCPVSSLFGRPERGLQIHTDASLPAEANHVPSGAIATERTQRA